ncbi:arginine transport ATP-binding protein ArtM [archaeon BMS3Abin16]|nr:arginine transport ATP-binding protein ArtM [archaeon BMS3Abin16]HDZ62375.1 ABC transporter ATP-binding protein [Nitrospirota bacterium]
MKPLLSVKNLSKVYEEKYVFKDLNFEVSKGEHVAIIAPNGAGKTTLIRILNLLEPPTSGEIHFKGDNITGAAEKWRIRRRMAVVFQRPAVLNTTVYENIAAGIKIRGEKKDFIDDKINNVLKDFNISGLKDKNARRLSGGEKQLLALARAVVLEPELLLLDEPTSNMDPENSALAMKAIENTKATVIIASPTDAVHRRMNRKINIERR